jgi:hypothetical protein
LTPDEILLRRRRNQRLAGAAFRHPEDVVAWFGAMQAQDYLGSLWAIGQRMRDAMEARVEAAEASRAIIRSWPMRGTLHFVAAADAKWLTKLLAPRVLARNAARLKRDFDLDAAVIARGRDIVTRALENGGRLERGALYRILEAKRIRTAGSRGLHILWWLAQEGTLCLAGRSGKQHTFALLDAWVPAARTHERVAALAGLASRYFASRGPATLKDFAWWAGLATRDAQEAVDGARPRLAHERLAGQEYFWRETRVAGAGATRAALAPSVKLLPGYDEYTVAYRDRSLLVHSAARGIGAGFGLLSPVVLVDGRVAGTWKRTLERRGVRVEAQLVRALTRAERAALGQATQEYGRFLGLDAQLKTGR